MLHFLRSVLPEVKPKFGLIRFFKTGCVPFSHLYVFLIRFVEFQWNFLKWFCLQSSLLADLEEIWTTFLRFLKVILSNRIHDSFRYFLEKFELIVNPMLIQNHFLGLYQLRV